MAVTCSTCGKLSPEGVLGILCGAYLKPPIKCPGCGRTTAAHVRKCQYCNAGIVAVRAPEPLTFVKCGRKLAAHLAVCQMCGAAQPRGGPAAPRTAEKAGPPSPIQELILLITAPGPVPSPQVDQALELIKVSPTRPAAATGAASLLASPAPKACIDPPFDEAFLLFA